MTVRQIISGFCGVVALGWSPVGATEVAGWEVLELSDSCVMTMEYDGKGESQLMLFRARDGSTRVVASNSMWSAKKGEEYQVAIEIDEWRYGPLMAAGMSLATKNGFGVIFGPGGDFFAKVRTGRGMDIYLGDQLIDELSLSGTEAAGAATDLCLRKLDRRLSAEEGERAKFDHLPDDPFRENNPAIAPVRGVKPAKVVSMGVTNDDYPSAALRNGEEGTVVVRITVGTDGRASACSIARSSGSSTLDGTTCRLVSSRSRFTPAEDASGEKIAQSLTVPIAWSIPAPTQPVSGGLDQSASDDAAELQ